jgi:hydroxyacylglutathione hydrolase
MIHEIMPVGMLACNCSIVGDPVSREALVIDPGDEVEKITAVLDRHGLKVKLIVSTHTHIDHVGGLAALHRLTGAPVLIHKDDLELYRNLAVQASWLGVRTPATTQIDSFLREGDTVKWGAYAAEVMHTPGHTRGSICLYLPGQAGQSLGRAGDDVKLGSAVVEAPRLFAGDTLFAGGIGRTDLWGGSSEQIMQSLKNKVIRLPEDTIVYPGHGEATTIGEEKKSNPWLRGGLVQPY